MKYDIITFGSAAQDIYFVSEKFIPFRGRKFVSGEAVCFNLGSKVQVKEVFFSSGGGGTNAAATFARQGFSVAFCGQVGADYFGHLVAEELSDLKINIELMKKTPVKRTNVSAILMSPGHDRSILAFRGAGDLLDKSDIPWEKLKGAKLFYLAPFSGKLAGVTQGLTDFAKRNGILVAMNPGYDQLAFPRAKLEKILKNVDILILNQEEASLLTKLPYQKEKEIFKQLNSLAGGICIMTKGERGVVACDGKYLYKAPA